MVKKFPSRRKPVSRQSTVWLSALSTLALKRRGVTLMELIVVLSLVAILSFAVVYRFSAVSPARLRNAAEKLASDIRYAQQYAVTTGRWTKWDNTNPADDPPKANWYRIVWVPGSGSTNSIKSPLDSTKNFEVDFDDTPYTGVTFPYLGVSPKACQGSGGWEDNDLFFNSNGVPYCCTTVLVCEKMDEPFDVPLSYSGLPTKTVSVEPETGKVTVQ